MASRGVPWLPIAFLSLLWPIVARAGVPTPLDGLDLYRTHSLTLDQARHAVGGLLDDYLKALKPRNAADSERALAIRRQIEKRLRSLGGLAFARMNFSRYRTSSGVKSYVVWDVVDAKEAATRPDFTSWKARGKILKELSDAAWDHPSRDIPWNAAAQAVDDPVVTNRSKALSVLLALAQNVPPLRPAIARKIARFLPRLLRMREPGNRDLAYALTTILSGKLYPPDDVAHWRAWADQTSEVARANP